ncbi:MAG TPA: hypothetical protein VMX17_00470 [Candidatus Glassbacteria bacterium]|nr:hypothetical protein [Candidatus Glassbacteria bacterium]
MIIINNGMVGKETVNALNVLISKKVPVKTAYKLVKVVRKVNEILLNVNAKKQEIVIKHIERDEKGNPVLAMDNEGNIIPDRVKIANDENYQKDMQNFFEQEHELDVNKININDLGEIDIEPTQLMFLMWLIEAD